MHILVNTMLFHDVAVQNFVLCLNTFSVNKYPEHNKDESQDLGNTPSVSANLAMTVPMALPGVL